MTNSLLWGDFTIALILGCGAYHTVKSRFIQFRLPKLLKLEGGKNQLKVIFSALAASLGTGNITGCAAAIATGGAGAVFWMWVSAFGSMAVAYSENRIGAEYARKAPTEKASPMLYIKSYTGSKGLALLYAAGCLMAAFFMGSMSQSGAFADTFSEEFHTSRFSSSLLAAAIVSCVIFSSKKAVTAAMSFAERLVPIMAVLYTAGCIAILIYTKSNVLSGFSEIFGSAFSPSAAFGGTVGISVKTAISTGLRRGIFSNEAGMGSSVLVHSEGDFGSPERVGAWAAFEVFLDTIVCCTLTALVVICCGDGKSTLSAVFGSVFGKTGSLFICLCVCLFALASILGWCCCGEKSFAYFTNSRYIFIYKALICVSAVIGGIISMNTIFGLCDIFNCIILMINLSVITLIISNYNDKPL